jgi:hypothetical protein
MAMRSSRESQDKLATIALRGKQAHRITLG